MSKILVLDDDKSNADVMQLILESEDFEVQSINQSALLSAAIQNFNPDLILMDVILDTSDGRILCNELKEDHQTKHIPVFLVTALLENQVAKIPCKPDALMFKPFDYDKFTNKVLRLINN